MERVRCNVDELATGDRDDSQRIKPPNSTWRSAEPAAVANVHSVGEGFSIVNGVIETLSRDSF